MSEVVRHQSLTEIEYLKNKLEEKVRNIENNYTLYHARLNYETKEAIA